MLPIRLLTGFKPAFTGGQASALVSLSLLWVTHGTAADRLPNLFPFPNASGFVATATSSGEAIDLNGPFFQPLGTNGRTCFTCHRPAQGWSLSPEEVQLRFDLTFGRDPLFRSVDGTNCDNVPSQAGFAQRRRASSLLLSRGLIRVPIAVPANAEFSVLGLENPYGCSDSATLSTYRRPIPTTNLRALSAIMWDGRESAPQTGTQKITFGTNPDDLVADLQHQSADAVSIHAQGETPISSEIRQQITTFVLSLHTAQTYDFRAGQLQTDGAHGGPVAIVQEIMPEFYIGSNDPLGGNPKPAPFTPVIFTLFESWSTSLRSWFAPFEAVRDSQRQSIQRGEMLFNSKPISITNVGGLNDDLNLPAIPGTCGTCHDTPNLGNHSLPVPLNIGVGDLDSSLDVSYLPVFTLQNNVTFDITRTTDPGRALISGLWKDIGRMKGPVLRGLASRAPYFHNGSARTLSDVVAFYNTRFAIGLNETEKQDLIAFLNAL